MKYFRNTQLGVTLIDALIAMVVAGVGLLALAFFQSDLVSTSAESKNRTRAVHLAQDKLEELRNLSIKDDFITYTTDADGNVIYDVGSKVNFVGAGDDADSAGGDGSTYAVNWEISPDPSDSADAANQLNTDKYAKIKVTVSWDDVDGTPQNVVLSSFIAWSDPQTSADEEETSSLTAGGAAPSPTGSAYLGGTPLDVTGVDNKDGTEVRYSTDGKTTQIVQMEYADDSVDGGLVAASVLLTIDGQAIRLRGRVVNELDIPPDDVVEEDIVLTRILTSDAGVCQFNDGERLGQGDLTNGQFSCYVASDWYGNLGVLTHKSSDEAFICAATVRYQTNAEIKTNEYFLDENNDVVISIFEWNNDSAIQVFIEEEGNGVDDFLGITYSEVPSLDPVDAGSFEVGTEYIITISGDTEFTEIGAFDNDSGTIFTAIGIGSGTGTATPTADAGILGTLVGQNFYLREGGCITAASGQFQITGTIEFPNKKMLEPNEVKINGQNCTLSNIKNSSVGYTCTAQQGTDAEGGSVISLIETEMVEGCAATIATLPDGFTIPGEEDTTDVLAHFQYESNISAITYLYDMDAQDADNTTGGDGAVTYQLTDADTAVTSDVRSVYNAYSESSDSYNWIYTLDQNDYDATQIVNSDGNISSTTQGDYVYSDITLIDGQSVKYVIVNANGDILHILKEGDGDYTKLLTDNYTDFTKSGASERTLRYDESIITGPGIEHAKSGVDITISCP